MTANPTKPKLKPSLNQDLREWIADHYGVISSAEATRLSATPAYIRARLDRGDWVRMHTGVYRDTAVAKTPLQALRAASLATRVGLVSHSSAAWLWDLLPDPPAIPELSVLRAKGKARRPNGVTIHRIANLDVSEGVLHKQLMVTSPMRALVDLAGTVAPALLTDALDAALAGKVVPLQAITGELERLSRRGRPGVRPLRRELHDRGFIGAPAASVLEARMLRIIVAAGLPAPAVELKVGDDGEYRLDFAWPGILLSIEVDGYVWHWSPEQQQRDNLRRNALRDRGWTLRVYTWRDVCDEPARVGREIVAQYRKLQPG